MVAAVDGDGVGVGLEEGVEVGEGGLAVAALEEPALAARGKDLWAEEMGQSIRFLFQEPGTTIINK